MSDSRKPSVTVLLDLVREGDDAARVELFETVYDELRRMARNRLSRERGGQTLQATAMVHEVYLRIARDADVAWHNRRHFFGAAAEAMRRIGIERARRYARQKHGANARRVELDDGLLVTDERGESLLALDAALEQLEARDATMAEVVKLRFFAGLSIPETARAMDTSPRTINRLWTGARAWLHQQIAEAEPPFDRSG